MLLISRKTFGGSAIRWYVWRRSITILLRYSFLNILINNKDDVKQLQHARTRAVECSFLKHTSHVTNCFNCTFVAVLMHILFVLKVNVIEHHKAVLLPNTNLEINLLQTLKITATWNLKFTHK